jgi:hypothetical protein
VANYKIDMRNWIVLLMLMCFGHLYAQKSDSVFQLIGHRIFNGVQPMQITKLDDLPEKIQVVTLDFIKKRFVDYSLKIKFVNAQISTIDSLFIEDIEALKENNAVINPIPYYDLYFSFKDIDLGISQYVIWIGIDKFGQVIDCNFPRIYNNSKIYALEKVTEYSDSLLVAKYPEIKIDKRTVSLSYDKGKDILIWQICYPKTYKGQDGYCFEINALSSELIYELIMMEDIPNPILCCEPSPVEIIEREK